MRRTSWGHGKIAWSASHLALSTRVPTTCVLRESSIATMPSAGFTMPRAEVAMRDRNERLNMRVNEDEREMLRALSGSMRTCPRACSSGSGSGRSSRLASARSGGHRRRRAPEMKAADARGANANAGLVRNLLQKGHGHDYEDTAEDAEDAGRDPGVDRDVGEGRASRARPARRRRVPDRARAPERMGGAAHGRDAKIDAEGRSRS